MDRTTKALMENRRPHDTHHEGLSHQSGLTSPSRDAHLRCDVYNYIRYWQAYQLESKTLWAFSKKKKINKKNTGTALCEAAWWSFQASLPPPPALSVMKTDHHCAFASVWGNFCGASNPHTKQLRSKSDVTLQSKFDLEKCLICAWENWRAMLRDNWFRIDAQAFWKHWL